MNGANRHLKARFRVKEYIDALIEIVIYAADEKEFNRLRKNNSSPPALSMETRNKYGSVMLEMQAENITRVDT